MFLKTYDFSTYEAYLWEVAGRTELDAFDQSQWYTFERGFVGEKIFYDAVKNTSGGVKLWNVRLRSNGEVQFDFMLIKDGFIVHVDVKNFAGKYVMSNNNFVSENNYVNANSLVQLDKAEKKLKYFCMKNDVDFQVKSYVLFVNPTFELSGLEGNEQILYASDISRIVGMLSKGEPTNEELRIGELLKKHHHPNSKYERIHYYPFESLKPGVKCPDCRTFLPMVHGRDRKVRCNCGFEIAKSMLVRKAFDVINILKNDVVTVADICKYTGIGKTTVKNIMSKEYDGIGSNKNKKYRIRKNHNMIFEYADSYVICFVDGDKLKISPPTRKTLEN